MNSKNEQVRVAVVEDSESYRKGLQSIFRLSPHISCELMCRTAEEALRKIPEARPDVVLMDLGLPGMQGGECIRELRRIQPNLLIVILTNEERNEQVFAAIAAGACGHLVKESTATEIVEAIDLVCSGGSPTTAAIGRMLMEALHEPPQARTVDQSLSDREREVLELIAGGKRPKEIAARFGIATSTVQTYVRRIYEKLQVHSQAEAVAKYFKGR